MTNADPGNSPFRFLDLPPEVQNIIYEYHAAEDFGTFPKSFISYPNKELPIFSRLCKPNAFGLQRGAAATITAPNLFLTSKTTRDAGLPSFYLARPFCITTLTPQMGELAALRWLEAIGNERCKLIRSLEIAHFSNNKESLKDIMNHSHQKLSEKATVTYKCSDPQLLWGLGVEFQAGHPVGKGPTFSPQWGFKYDNFTQDCASLSFGEQYVTLEFLPNMGWFGQTTDLQGQSATEESPAEGSGSS